jgi:uncharacterized protein (TIGR00255 family)
MIYSMTGYGKGRAGNKKLSAEAEVKSINSRYFEVYLKLPQVLSVYDYDIREIVKVKIKRGKINLIITLDRNGEENGTAALDPDKLKFYLSFLKRIKTAAGIKEDIRMENILSFKELLTPGEWKLTAADFSIVKEAISKALLNLALMKKREGKALEKDLLQRLNKIDKQVLLIEKEFSNSIAEHFNNLKARVAELVDNVEVERERLNLELALMADRADITEEYVRLKSHLKFFREIIKKEEEPGRKLNFLCQEINREANTISSKSVSTSIIHKAVVIKEEIEKIREQIQNIE